MIEQTMVLELKVANFALQYARLLLPLPLQVEVTVGTSVPKVHLFLGQFHVLLQVSTSMVELGGVGAIKRNRLLFLALCLCT